MTFLRAAKFFVPFSAILVLTSLVLLVVPGPKLSIDFTGGTLMEVQLPEGKTKADLQAALQAFPFDPPVDNITISVTQKGTMFMRLRDIPNEEHLALIKHLETTFGSVQEEQFTTIGPTVGETLKQRAIWALITASIAIILYVAFAFRKVPRKLSAWRFGIIAVITLLHDVLITVGVFVLLSQITTFEVDTLFITALLTIMGYSVNDTIVVFDRIRDNLGNQARNEPFAAVAERALSQSLTRSFNTSFSTLIMLIALLIFGSTSIRWFVLALTVGIGIGTYSSIFLATPLLVYWKKKER